MAKWLVTGGAGFIGSHIAETLVKMGEKVRILDNFFSGSMESLSGFENKVDLVRGDIRDAKDVAKAMRGVDYCLHQAALRSVSRSMSYPEETNDVNVGGILACLLGAARAKVKRFVFASSSSVYGDSLRFPQKVQDFPAPISPYAVSKLTGEFYCKMFTKSFGLSTVSLRYFNVFGPRQDPKSKYAVVVPRFIISALQGAPLKVHWDGLQSRDFTFVSDIVRCNILAAQAPNPKNGVYNVGCGSTASLLTMIKLLESFAGKKLTKEFVPKREGDVRKTFADIEQTVRELKYKPELSFAQGLERTYNFFKENNRWKKYL